MDPRRLARRLHLATLAGCVGLCLSALSGPRELRGAPQHALSPGELDTPASVTLETLLDEPTDWLGRTVRFSFQFHSAPPSWNPYLTRFGAADYVAAIAWCDDQLLWDEDEFGDPRALLFARRGMDVGDALARGTQYARYEAVGVVSQVFLGHPWIEVARLERLPEEVGEGAILHATRALRSMEQGEWRLALQDIARAEASNLPPPARAELARMRARCEAERQSRRIPSDG
jgi:hypothetical protein